MLEPSPGLRAASAGWTDFASGCCGFNRKAPSQRELPRNRASLALASGHLAAWMAWLARFYVAEENRAARWTACELVRPALQRLAF